MGPMFTETGKDSQNQVTTNSLLRASGPSRCRMVQILPPPRTSTQMTSGRPDQGGGDGTDPVRSAADAQGQRNQIGAAHGLAHDRGTQRAVAEQRCRTAYDGALRDAQDTADRRTGDTRGGQPSTSAFGSSDRQPLSGSLHGVPSRPTAIAGGRGALWHRAATQSGAVAQSCDPAPCSSVSMTSLASASGSCAAGSSSAPGLLRASPRRA